MTTLTDLPPDPRGGRRMRRIYGERIVALGNLSSAIIAAELGLKERTVVMLQRKLGLRGCRQPGEDDA